MTALPRKRKFVIPSGDAEQRSGNSDTSAMDIKIFCLSSPLKELFFRNNNELEYVSTRNNSNRFFFSSFVKIRKRKISQQFSPVGNIPRKIDVASRRRTKIRRDSKKKFKTASFGAHYLLYGNRSGNEKKNLFDPSETNSIDLILWMGEFFNQPRNIKC